MSAGALCFEAVQALDRELAHLARNDGILRLELGAGLEALARIGGHHELGFASVEVYALERCERSARWVQEARALARKLEELPALRRALAVGELSFSMAQVLAKVASADDEQAWLAQAEARTVREMQRLVRRADCDDSTNELIVRAEEEPVTLTVTVDREDAWLFECARMVGQQLSALTRSDTLEALLGEGTSSLLARVRRDSVTEFDDSDSDVAQREWEAELGRWREEADLRCEGRIRRHHADSERAETTVQPEFAFDGSERDPSSIDAKLRQVAAELLRRDLELGRLAEQFWKADGWRRLGYATEAQYLRERLGMSGSTLKAKRALARRATQLPEVTTALEAGRLGYEAARLVASVATPETVEEWLARASARTVRFLREEIDAIEMFARLAPGRMASPPSEETMQALAALESRVVSGALFLRHAKARCLRVFGAPSRRIRVA